MQGYLKAKSNELVLLSKLTFGFYCIGQIYFNVFLFECLSVEYSQKLFPVKKETSLAKADPTLHRIIEQVPRPVIESTHNVFHDLMSCVIEQQIHYRSTKKIFHNMLQAANLIRLTPQNFDTFEKIALSKAKLSISKQETIMRVLSFFKEDQTSWHLLSDEDVISKLSSIKGIGKWTIDMILLYTLQRPNVFPYDDFHLKQIMVSLYKLDAKTKLKAQMIEVAQNWGEHQSLAVLYLLAYKNLTKGGI